MTDITENFSLRIYDDKSGDYIEIAVDEHDLFVITSNVGGATRGKIDMTEEFAMRLADGIKKVRDLNAPKIEIKWFTGDVYPPSRVLNDPSRDASPFPPEAFRAPPTPRDEGGWNGRDAGC